MENGNDNEAQSLPSEDVYTAQDVADAFVKQYYNILRENPQDSHRFYKEKSILAYPCPDGSMKLATTVDDINDVIMRSNIKEWNPNLTTVHAQDTIMESVIVGVTGSLTDNDNVTRNFAQTFLLATQEGGGFYVHNDFLQFIEINKISEPSPNFDDNMSPRIASDAVDEEEDSPKKDQNQVTSSSKGKNPLLKEANKKSKSLKLQEDAKRLSYASIVAKEGPVASPPQSSVTLPVKPSTLASNDLPENMNDIKSIIIKDLPPKMTQESLAEIVKQFGPVKPKNIQIKEYSEDGYRYAFVDFDNPKSARIAVEARFIQFDDRESEIQYKRFHNQGGHNYMGRPGSWPGSGSGSGFGYGSGYGGRGGFRNENFWGRDGGNWGRSNSNEQDYYRRGNRYYPDPPRSF